MNSSLLFLPDISGFTEFVTNTEVEHSTHVIAELLEILIEANEEDLVLAEIEGDALFFYKENEVPSLEKLLAQVEAMFTAFYSHLELLAANRICPCNACSTAPNLQLKIIAHSGQLQFINVHNNRKPFGGEVIEVHRLLKNSVHSDNYVLFSESLKEQISLPADFNSTLFNFQQGKDTYDGKQIDYRYSIIDNDNLKLHPFERVEKVQFDKPPSLSFTRKFPVAAEVLLEYITNLSYREYWVEGVDSFEFQENEVTRIGSKHICVIKQDHLDFVSVLKEGKPGQLVYGEKTTSPPPVDALYQFYIISPHSTDSCELTIEIYFEAKSLIKKAMIFGLAKRVFKKNVQNALDKLQVFVASRNSAS